MPRVVQLADLDRSLAECTVISVSEPAKEAMGRLVLNESSCDDLEISAPRAGRRVAWVKSDSEIYKTGQTLQVIVPTAFCYRPQASSNTVKGVMDTATADRNMWRLMYRLKGRMSALRGVGQDGAGGIDITEETNLETVEMTTGTGADPAIGVCDSRFTTLGKNLWEDTVEAWWCQDVLATNKMSDLKTDDSKAFWEYATSFSPRPDRRMYRDSVAPSTETGTDSHSHGKTRGDDDDGDADDTAHMRDRSQNVADPINTVEELPQILAWFVPGTAESLGSKSDIEQTAKRLSLASLSK